MATDYTIEVHFGDENLTPEKIRSQDIATLISSIERMIAAIVARDNPELDIDESKVTVGLSAIVDGSYGMQFISQYDREVKQAYEKITNAIAVNNYDDMPFHSIDSIRKVVNLSRAYRTETALGYRNGGFVPIAKLTSNTAIQTETPMLEGSTTLYGILTGIGGISPPSAKLTLINGVKLDCNVTERDDLIVARQLGRRLYTEVGVKGLARWDLRDMSIVFFRIDELLDFQEIPLTEALENLYEVAGQDFEAIEDIDAFMADLRGNERTTE